MMNIYMMQMQLDEDNKMFWEDLKCQQNQPCKSFLVEAYSKPL